MKNIQLRWLHSLGSWRRLQYRCRDRHLDIAFADPEDFWSDWADVPDVTETPVITGDPK
jgi:hypothetical protein